MRTIGIVCCGLLLALALARPARADIAPPEQPPGSSIGSAQQTQVQMLAEQVLIEVQPAPEIEPGNEAAEQLLADLRQQVAGELLLETPTAGPVATATVEVVATPSEQAVAQVPTLAPTIALTAEPTVPAADSTGTGNTRLPAGAGIVLLLVGAFGLLSLAAIMALLVLRRRRS